jgi:hypothetical protein
VSLSQSGKFTYPVSLKALLRAEEAVLDSQLQTSWALEGSSFILAVGAHTLLLGGGISSHRVGVDVCTRVNRLYRAKKNV